MLSYKPNPLSANLMRAAERLAEVAELLALGLVRLRARQSSGLSHDRGERFVDFMAGESGGHTRRETAGRTT